MEQLNNNRTFAMIDGMMIVLPDEAKYIAQEASGTWFWYERKPRLVNYDKPETGPFAWGVKNKNPVMIPNARYKVLVTEVVAPCWTQTLARTISPGLKPSAVYS